MPDVTRRPERPDDAAFRLRLLRETQGDVLAGLDPALAETLLVHQLAGQTMTYRARYPGARHEIVEVGGVPIGRMVVDRADAAMTLVDVTLSAASRGQGIGTRLLRDLLAEADAAGVPTRLSVRADNPARRLYARLGFVEVGASEMDVAMEKRTSERRLQPPFDTTKPDGG